MLSDAICPSEIIFVSGNNHVPCECSLNVSIVDVFEYLVVGKSFRKKMVLAGKIDKRAFFELKKSD